MEGNIKLTLGSLFDGSGGFPLGGLLAGITPVWASEIEPFPIRVTTKRLPFMKHYGDISKMNGAEIEPVDIITFGSPCQDLSLAGRRVGINGSRSSLFYEAIRVIKEMRCKTNGKYPRYIVWENVPGAFSSNKGADFKAVLEEIIGIKEQDAEVPMPEKGNWAYADILYGDGWSIAYRVLDAQFWGVPQRRRRIFLVADFGGKSAGKILFESEGVSGYSAEGFSSWQRTAGGFKKGTGKTGGLCLNDQGGNRMDVTDDVTNTLRAEAHHPPCVMEATVYENHSQDTRYTEVKDVAPTVLSTYGTGGNNQPFVVNAPMLMKIRSGCEGGGKGILIQTDKSATLSTGNDRTLFKPKAYGICSKESNAMKSDNPKSGIYEADTSRTIDGRGGNPSCNQGGIAIVSVQGSMIGRSEKNGPQGSGINEDVSFTLNATDKHAVAYGIDRAAFNQGKNALYDFAVEPECQPTMVAKGPGAVAQPISFYPQMKAECMTPREDVSNTLVNGTNPGFQNAVATPVYSSNKASFFTLAEEDKAGTLVASDYKDPPLINEQEYTVRRLTPLECCRLQGFPDWWCSDLETPHPTNEDISFWRDVFETHRKITGTSSKPKSDAQIIKWLNNPHSDSAEYKMWGNGVALPCVYFVLSGIMCYINSED